MSFRRFFLVRLGWALFGIWLAVTLVFVIFRVLSLPVEEFKDLRDPSAVYRAYVKELQLDKPVPERYARYVWRLVTEQSPGRSSITNGDSGDIGLHALPVTASLVALTLLFSVAVAAAVGIPWGRAGPRAARLANVPIYIAFGLTPIVVGSELAYHVGFKWGVTPVAGYCDFFSPPSDAGCGGAGDWLSHLVLPVLTLSLYFAAVYARIVRAGVVRILATRAATESPSEPDHLNRRLALVLGRILGRDFGFAMGVGVLVEQVFALPGLGSIAVQAVGQFDLVVLESVVLYAAALAVGVHFVVDIIVGALDKALRADWPVAGIPGHP